MIVGTFHVVVVLVRGLPEYSSSNGWLRIMIRYTQSNSRT